MITLAHSYKRRDSKVAMSQPRKSNFNEWDFKLWLRIEEKLSLAPAHPWDAVWEWSVSTKATIASILGISECQVSHRHRSNFFAANKFMTTFLMFRPKFVFIDKNKWQRSAVINGCSYHWGEPNMITMSRWVLRSNEIEKVSCACKIKKTSNESLIDLVTMMCEKEDFKFNAELIDLKWTRRLDDNRSIRRRNVLRYKQSVVSEQFLNLVFKMRFMIQH